MSGPLVKATMIALCFAASACSTLPPPESQAGADHEESPCTQKSMTGAFSGSATQAVLDGIGKKLNVTGLGQTAGRAVEKKLNCP